jgi:hypothetical protein
MPDFNRIAARRYHAAREASRVSFSRFEVFTFGGATVAAVAAAFLACVSRRLSRRSTAGRSRRFV